MGVLTRCLLFVSVPLLIVAGCSKTPQQAKQQAAQDPKHALADQDSTGSRRSSADPAANGDLKPVADSNTSRTARPAWPRSMGEFGATSRDGIPFFPQAMTGYLSQKGKDYEGKPYPTRGSITVEDGSEWKGLRHFPKTRNGCSAGVFMMRWRVSDPAIRVYSTIDNPRKSTANVATGAFGYMYGSVCDKPQFKFAKATKPNWPGRVDVFYELKFWEATP